MSWTSLEIRPPPVPTDERRWQIGERHPVVERSGRRNAEHAEEPAHSLRLPSAFQESEPSEFKAMLWLDMSSPHPANQSVLTNPLHAIGLLSFAGKAVLTLFVLGWLFWFAPFDDLVDRSGTPLGGDYVMFHVAGQTLLNGDAATLYDDAENQKRSASLFPAMDPNESWPYRYPPVTAWLMTSLANLSFGISFACFFAMCVAAVVFAIKLLVGELDRGTTDIKPSVFWLLLGWPLVGEALMGGQSSPFALLFVVGGVIALRRDRDFLGGVLIGLCIYKPNIVGMVVIGTLIARPKAFWGMLSVAVPALLLSIHAAGVEGVQRYIELASSLATAEWNLETPFWKVHGIAPLLDVIAPGRGKPLAFVCGIPVAIWFGLKLRRSQGHDWWAAVAGLLATNALFNPYVPIYDLLLLLPVIAIVSRMPAAGRNLSFVDTRVAIIAALFLAPHLSQALTPSIGVQVFPVVLIAVLWMLADWSREPENASVALSRV